MQDNPFSASLTNTFRDSNDNSRSASRPAPVPTSNQNYEEMECSPAEHLPIHDSNEYDGMPLQYLNPVHENQVNNRAPHKSVIRSYNIDGDDDNGRSRAARSRLSSPPPPPPLPPLINARLIDNHDARPEAAGYGTSRVGELDADAAYALQLQQEEYSRDTMVPRPHRFVPFNVDDMDGTASRHWGQLGYPFMNGDDDDMTAMLQFHAAQQRSRQRPGMPHGPATRRTNPQPSQASNRDGPEVIAVPTFSRSVERPFPYNDDESDDDVVRSHPANALFHLLSNPHGSMHPAFPQYFRGYRGRGSRRGGNLQETEDDFGPEDYERLLQLDDTINKKKLTKEQISSIPREKFSQPANKSDEENQCGICLERFEENQALRRFPCAHLYHQECADRWLQESNACPICREPPIKVAPRSHSRSRRGAPYAERSMHAHRNTTTNTRTTHPSRSHPSYRGGRGGGGSTHHQHS